jgi:hypothetical protein
MQLMTQINKEHNLAEHNLAGSSSLSRPCGDKQSHDFTHLSQVSGQERLVQHKSLIPYRICICNKQFSSPIQARPRKDTHSVATAEGSLMQVTHWPPPWKHRSTGIPSQFRSSKLLEPACTSTGIHAYLSFLLGCRTGLGFCSAPSRCLHRHHFQPGKQRIMNQRPKEIDCGGKKCHSLVITFSMFARVIELTSWSIM